MPDAHPDTQPKLSKHRE